MPDIITIPGQYTPSSQQNECITVTNYTLNKNKAAQKMINATNQEMNVEAEFKRGTLVLNFTPAAFLMLHKQLMLYYKQSHNLITIPHLKKDKSNLVVEESLSIKSTRNNPINRRQMYRVNMFKTSFTVSVNGKDLGHFISTDLPDILSTMPLSDFIHNMNKEIQEKCSAYLATQNNTDARLQEVDRGAVSPSTHTLQSTSISYEKPI